ncbi:MAG: hypothetical protein WA633_28775 [Stellaceae bacterium]
MTVSDPRLGQLGGKGVGVELRVGARAGHREDIDQQIDRGLPQ